MFFFLITCCFSLLFFYNSLSIINPLPAWACDMRLLSLWFWKDSSFSQITKSIRGFRIPCKKNKVETTIETTSSHMSVLDLPDLVLESILEKLPPEGLFRMASVCKSLRDRCLSDHFWEKHMNAKWGKLVGPAAYREWRSRKGSVFLDRSKRKGLLAYLTHFIRKRNNFPLLDSTMAWYFALESGRFWFPAQVYNRENGHVGFMLSCYDAELRYDQRTNTFEARYPPHGRRASPTETEVPWDRLRAPPVDTSPHDLHVSDCLNDLQPGDHIEIQWRRNKGFPYGWWYGVVGHLETCDGHDSYCRCRDNDTVILEFNQYSRGSRWRTTAVNRKHHREEGNEADGFYGGIRKLYTNEEISMWKTIWPPQVLE